MNDVFQLIDLIVTAMLNFWNVFRDNGGIWFIVWVAVVFALPWLKRLLRSLRS